MISINRRDRARAECESGSGIYFSFVTLFLHYRYFCEINILKKKFSYLLLLSFLSSCGIWNRNRTIVDDFVLIPKGSINLYSGDQDVIWDTSVNSRQQPVIAVDSFYISKFEVTNYQYREFLYAIKREKDSSLPFHQFSRTGDTAFYRAMLPDSNVWIPKSDYTKSETYSFYSPVLAEYYLKHPAYNDYPVVGISWEQANAYCTFITEMNNAYAKKKFQKVLFRLPTKAEWEYAASGGKSTTDFPWEGDRMMDEKGNPKANFKVIDQGSIGRMTYSTTDLYGNIVEPEAIVGSNYENIHDTFDPLLPVKSLEPGHFGLYHMGGNVEEMISRRSLTKGGSWNDTGFYLRNYYSEVHDSTDVASAERGFRMVMIVIEE